ncbi:MAG TPA: DNA cytosine methyltransferase [Chthoniobacterales bacterium]|nr:DNA cytosine methyltransferase [Chthoniobacterales bacterium]
MDWRLTHLDLFTGIGGFHLAAEWAGFETVGFAEVKPYCCRLLNERWPTVPNYGDIRTADFSGLRGRVDVLSAGVPCQPSSLAGKRRGTADNRWLWPAALDVVRDVQPTWVIFENPPGILSLDEFGGVLLRLESFGYQVRMFSVPANAVGAKHRRQRVFIVANAGRRRCNGPAQWEDQQPGRTEVIGPSNDTDTNGNDQYGRSGDVQMGRSRSAGGTKEDVYPKRNQWVVEPAVGRVAHGIPNRSHRLNALGNAVVPQQAYPFFAAIAQTIGCVKLSS